MLPAQRAGYLLGVDTSASQDHVDVAALAAAGVGFLFARATDGEHSVDPWWATTAGSCRAEELPFGAYGVLEPYGTARAEAQARHFVDTMKEAGTTLPPALDFELAHNLTGLAALEAAAIWCETVEAALGRQVIVYTGPAFIETLERYAGPAGAAIVAKLGARPLWMAWYAPEAKIHAPPPWIDWTIWQATGDGAAHMPNGVPIDVDWFRGTAEDLLALGAPATEQDPRQT